MTLPLPFPDVRRQTPQGQVLDVDGVQQNLEKISMEWPQASSNWTSYTATATVTLGTGGTNTARYQKNGRTVHVHGRIVLGTGGSFTGSPVTIALPFAASALQQYGTLVGNNEGVALYVGVVSVAASASVFTGAFEGNAAFTATSPFTWGDTDSLTWNLTYEAAS